MVSNVKARKTLNILRKNSPVQPQLNGLSL